VQGPLEQVIQKSLQGTSQLAPEYPGKQEQVPSVQHPWPLQAFTQGTLPQMTELGAHLNHPVLEISRAATT